MIGKIVAASFWSLERHLRNSDIVLSVIFGYCVWVWIKKIIFSAYFDRLVSSFSWVVSDSIRLYRYSWISISGTLVKWNFCYVEPFPSVPWICFNKSLLISSDSWNPGQVELSFNGTIFLVPWAKLPLISGTIPLLKTFAPCKSTLSSSNCFRRWGCFCLWVFRHRRRGSPGTSPGMKPSTLMTFDGGWYDLSVVGLMFFRCCGCLLLVDTVNSRYLEHCRGPEKKVDIESSR